MFRAPNLPQSKKNYTTSGWYGWDGKNLVFTISWFILDFFLLFRIFFNPRILPSRAPTNHPTILLGVLGLANLNYFFCKWHFMILHFRKWFFVYWDQMNSLCMFQKGHIKLPHISNKTLTSKINPINQINKTIILNRWGCMEKGMSIWS